MFLLFYYVNFCFPYLWFLLVDFIVFSLFFLTWELNLFGAKHFPLITSLNEFYSFSNFPLLYFLFPLAFYISCLLAVFWDISSTLSSNSSLKFVISMNSSLFVAYFCFFSLSSMSCFYFPWMQYLLFSLGI